MRFFRLQGIALIFSVAFALGLIVTTQQQSAYCQETTGGLQGSVKDPTGAVVPKATVTVTGTAMIGSKELVTDSSGYYRFANLPPGVYAIVVKADGFQNVKREGLAIEVGHLPTIDIQLKVGTAATTVEVTGAAPVIDTSTTQNITNINSAALQSLPTGTSFQSVIQFAPMARNEPLSGYSVNGRGTGGSGGSMPGSSGNGNSFGYSIGGAADSESSYLVEGQDTENISGGYSKANVPMDFIDEVQMKTSGVNAEYGGALGGVINVVMKKGSDQFHGSSFSTYEGSGLDANDTNGFLRYDPSSQGVFSGTLRQDPLVQTYSPSKDHFTTVQPGVRVGGPILKDRLWFVAGFNPSYSSRAKTVDFGAYDNNAGKQYFTRDRQQYYGYLRFDAALTQKIRVFGSWLDQYARQTGSLPVSDPIASESTYLNRSIQSPLSLYSHGLGWSAPNATYNVGADVTLTQHLVSTTRFGYFFENYHDFGWPTGLPDVTWEADASGAYDNSSPAALLPDNLQNYNGQPAGEGTQTQPYTSTFTLFNADKHYQLNQDIALYKGGWAGTHNFKFGYQLNHLVNVISQNGNVPNVMLYPGKGAGGYSALTQTGGDNCGLLSAEWGGVCAGQYGYVTIQDFSTILADAKGNPTPASDWNHAFYVQDSWTLPKVKGLTLDVGLRIEKETLPAPGGIKVPAISFSWADKIEPRLGAAWDPSGRGKMKFFGSYGVVNDVMKLLLAQTSFGAQAYEDCTYPLGPHVNADGTTGVFSIADLTSVFVANRACPNGPANTQANFAGGKTPKILTDAATQVSIIENVNFRPWEPVAPGVKPYRQHEYVVGWDYEINPNLAIEARYDRRRLDHAIEDASLADVGWGEMFTIVNPGEGVNSTIDKYATFLASLGESFGVPGQSFDLAGFGTCPSCPANAKARRNYDGVELRLTVSPIHKIAGMFSYTYNSLWGNYPGLTTTDQSDGGITGRNSPDTTRAFDEPFYYFGQNGKSNDGKLPTDRPNVLKGYIYYALPWGKGQTTNIGLFQNFLQGTPLGSYIDIGGATSGQPYDGVYPWGRDKWVDITTDSQGNMTFGSPYTKRTPWYIQSDLNLAQEVRVGEGKSIKVEFTAQNALNQHSVAAYGESIDSWNNPRSTRPGGLSIAAGAAAYQAYESGYNTQSLVNTRSIVKNSQYGQPYLYQNGREFRIDLHYSF